MCPMVAKTSTAVRLDAYVCPICKAALEPADAALECCQCSQIFPVIDGLPDFVRQDLSKSDEPILRKVSKMDRLARFYESRFWYPLVLNLVGGLGSTTLGELIGEISAMVKDVEGRILDVACGPGTYGRRVASGARVVFGIDVSMNMLRQGVVYTEREGIDQMHFARARVESLPFADRFFDAALCCGSLHLFPDPVQALSETARTMKPNAPLAAMTFTPGGRGIVRFRRLRERLQRTQGVRVFDIAEMEGYLTAAGFDGFQPVAYGSTLVFRARRRAT